MVLHLHDEPFEKIKHGKKTVEMRLYDEKRSKLSVGEQIVFVKASNENEKLYAKIQSLHIFRNFYELYSHFDKCDLGYNEDETADSTDMEKYYPKEKQEKYGVLAIKFDLEEENEGKI